MASRRVVGDAAMRQRHPFLQGMEEKLNKTLWVSEVVDQRAPSGRAPHGAVCVLRLAANALIVECALVLDDGHPASNREVLQRGTPIIACRIPIGSTI
uniref:Uncharacterized protein n=1 Tax=Heterorhabditis bacteriophora TaxID=37862 RepID=A0A1I7WM67_HETBA